MSNAAEKMEEGSPVQAVAVTGLTPVNAEGGSVVVPPRVTNAVPMYQQEKIGAKCCGCCCDYRRAVIVVSIIFICSTAITLIVSIVGSAIPGTTTVDDDAAATILQDSATWVIIISAIGLAMAVIGLLGARMYNIPMLALVIVWFLVNYGLGVYNVIDNINQLNELDTSTTEYRVPIGWLIFQFVITCLWIYPYGGLIWEIKQGIMSYETYPREEYSCCCVDNRRRYQ